MVVDREDEGEGKDNKGRQTKEKNLELNKDELVPDKVSKVRRLLNVAPGKVESEIDMFWVDKEMDDIRLVYNGTSCGLNALLWAPWLSMPTVKCHLRSFEPGSYTGDIDIGDCCYNFLLH